MISTSRSNPSELERLSELYKRCKPRVHKSRHPYKRAKKWRNKRAKEAQR